MKTKKVRPILVKAKQSNLYLYDNKLYKTNWKYITVSETENLEPQQLILINLDPNEKIENSDLIYWENKIYNGKDFIEKYYPVYSDFFKVITIQNRLSPELIQQLVDEYNHGDMKDFEIKWEKYGRFNTINFPYVTSKPKLTNGFVTPVKKEKIKVTSVDLYNDNKGKILYTEEEVYKLTKEAVGLWRNLHDTKLYRNKEHHGKWWEEIKKK